MTFTIDSPANPRYADTGSDPNTFSKIVAAAADAVLQSAQPGVESDTPGWPSGYRITHVFQVADENGVPESLMYVESVDVKSWEQISPAIDALMTRTRTDGWTVSITISQLTKAQSGSR